MSNEIENILRLNCPSSCDGLGTYSEDDGYGNPEPAQCQWCFEFGMPARKAILMIAEEGVIHGWQASREGYNCEYPGSLSANGDDVEKELVANYLSKMRAEE